MLSIFRRCFLEVLEFKDVEFFKEFEQVWFNSAKGFDNDKEKVFCRY
jgi:hypothetical protein